MAVASCCMCAVHVSVSAQDVDVRTLDVRATRGAYRPGEVIVKFKSSSGIAMKAPASTRFTTSQVSRVDNVFQQIGVSHIAELMPLSGSEPLRKSVRAYNGKDIEAKPMSQAYILTLNEASADVHEAVEALKALSEVEYAEPNYLVYGLGLEDGDIPTDPYYSLQYGIDAIRLPELWKQPIINKTGPVIAIIDTGVDITHPDLAANIWTNEAESSGASGYDDDRNGFTDDVHGWDFVNQTGDINDYSGHGTHCAGIAAACGFNGTGIIGANPDAVIMPLTVLQSNGQGDVATIIKAVDYAIANGANILSMSLGSYSASVALEDALARAYQKAVIVAAAGNDALCLNHSHPEKGQQAPMPMFPAAYTFVLGVQASDRQGDLASFSNYDDDGAIFSAYGEEKLYNYELTVPGAFVMSTYPGGGYKSLNGTSMATPLVAGAVSRLLQAKEYDNKELLFGDLIHATTDVGNLDIYQAFATTDADRQPELQFVTFDMVDADGDGRADAGEEIAFYPVIRNAWGNATNITYKIECAELVNTTFDILDETANFGVNLPSYGKARALNPVRIKFHDNVADGRIVRLKFTAQGENAPQIEQELEVIVENAVELTGLLREDMTLTPDQHYVVVGTFGVPEGRTLTIEPGTTIKFRDNAKFSAEGTVIANGEPGKMITFTKGDLDMGYIQQIDLGPNDISYCIFENLNCSNYPPIMVHKATHCVMDNVSTNVIFDHNRFEWECSNIINSYGTVDFISWGSLYHGTITKSNFVNNIAHAIGNNYGIVIANNGALHSSNVFNNLYNNNKFQLMASAQVYGQLGILTHPEPCYFGTSLVDIAKERVIDINHPMNKYVGSITEYDFSNMPTKPYAEAPGIVWKVVVNGYDAQDEFDKMPPLGVGTHTFDVYFNRPMNKDVAPMIAMGVRAPYTQTAISENGSWNEAGDVYTAQLTITGKSAIDGLNRIYVSGAEDNEYFKIPVEDYRFNVLVQAAGSMSSGFMAEAGLGRVTLTWDNEEEENIDDILGFNMYRYEIDENGIAGDTICINRQLLEPQEDMELTDYDVVPRQTYAYFYKTMRTDMSETSPSKTVAVTPQTATQGDANGSGDVDVADVITTVNYASGLEPKPFIFEAADMNADLSIDILDVVGIIRTILYPNAAAAMSAEATATYTVDDEGTLYIETPVALAGVQLNLTMDENGTVRGLYALDGFEQTGAWLNEDNYIFMAYNMSGRTIEPGRHAIATISNGSIDDIRLSDALGANVQAVPEMDASAVQSVNKDILPYTKGVYTLTGIKLSSDKSILHRLPAGVYIVNGKKVVK